MTCRQALEKIVQHMQGSCFKKTRNAIFITTQWDSTAFEEWKANLFQIQHLEYLEVYLLVGSHASPIKIKPFNDKQHTIAGSISDGTICYFCKQEKATTFLHNNWGGGKFPVCDSVSIMCVYKM